MNTFSTVETVLLVTDQISVLDALYESSLATFGIQVMTARDGPSGLDLAIRLNPDLIILEQSMALMTGLEVLSILKQTACGSSIILLVEP